MHAMPYLKRLIWRHINEAGMVDICETEAEMDWIESTEHCIEYLERNYLFFLTMLASEGAPYFRKRFLQHNIESFKKDIDVTKGKILTKARRSLQNSPPMHMLALWNGGSKWNAIFHEGNGKESRRFARADFIILSNETNTAVA